MKKEKIKAIGRCEIYLVDDGMKQIVVSCTIEGGGGILYVTPVHDFNNLPYNIEEGKYEGKSWDLEKGTRYIEEEDKWGNVLQAIFLVKMHMDETHRTEFRDWLKTNRPELLEYWEQS